MVISLTLAVLMCGQAAAPARAEAQPASAVTAATPAPSAPAAAAPKPTVLVLDLEAAGVSKDDAHFVTAEIARTLAEPSTVNVLTAADLRRLASLESDKQAMGCEAQSCLAELANAMGAEYVVFGTIGRIDEQVMLEVSLFAAVAARPVGRRDVKAPSLSVLLKRTPREVHALAGELLPPYAGPDIDEPAAPSALVVAGGITAGVGTLAALVGAAGAGFAAGRVLDDKAAARERNDAKTVGAIATIGAGAGGALVAIGVGLAALGWGGE